ncbi:MAG TPA: hypothetical protein VHW44_13355 [Pseudonocardiaceae bacterium]|jgi:hypothetical protein|nr:hypothetical protein [Pseudonocardiaceae bacterium]
MTDWTEFAVITGGAAGALIGLFFVAVSIRITVIAGSPELRDRAAQTLGLFLIILLSAVLVAVPGQPDFGLGIELVVLAVLAGAAAMVLDQQAKRHRGTHRIARTLENATPNAVTAGLTGAGGITLITGAHAGLYLLVPAAVAALTGGVINAWLILVALDD